MLANRLLASSKFSLISAQYAVLFFRIIFVRIMYYQLVSHPYELKLKLINQTFSSTKVFMAECIAQMGSNTGDFAKNYLQFFSK